jgi:ABC-type polysaccharide/polyol phosphate export permease
MALILLIPICFLGGVVVVLASWCSHLTHRQRDLRQLVSILTLPTLSDIAKRVIELDNKHSHHLT